MAIPEIGEDVPLGNNTGKSLPSIGADVPLIDPSLLAVAELPKEVKEPISTSAVKDFKKTAGGIWELAKMAGNVFVPGEENTLIKLGQYLETAYEKGELTEDAWNFTKEAIIAPLRNLGADISPIIDEGIAKGTPQAAENIARRPFSFTMDVISALGLGKAVAGGAKAGAAMATGKSMKDISKRVAMSERIAVARPAEELVGELDNALGVINSKISDSANKALSALPDDVAKGFTVKEVSGLMDKVADTLKKDISTSGQKAKGTIQEYKARLKKVYPDGKMSPRDVKSTIMQLDNDIDWDAATNKATNKAIKQLRRETDMALKAKFPDYEANMRPLADLMETREEAAQLLGIKRINGEWNIPDMAGSRISRLFKGKIPKQKSKEVLEKFGRETGLDIVGEMEVGTFADEFARPVTQGSWRPVTGGAIGAVMGATGGLPGMAMGAGKGAVIGGVLDKWGGVALSRAIDAAPGAFRVAGNVAESIPSKTLLAPIATEAIREAGEE